VKRSGEILNWRAPADSEVIGTVDMHTGGEPLRVIVSGLPPIEGDTVLEKRRYFREHFDHLRTGLMFEPRGHADMYGAVISLSNDADFDVFFLHNEGYSTMCGHAIIALTKLVIETGTVERRDVSFNVPAGRIEATATIVDDRVIKTAFRNVPSYLYLRDQVVEVEDVGPVPFDVAYGGAFYAVIDASHLGLSLETSNYSEIIRTGRAIKQAIVKTTSIEHPIEPDLSFLYGTIFTAPPHSSQHHSRNVCVFADGEIDRSPTGSGVSARAALHYARGELGLNECITIESILGSTMSVEVMRETMFGGFKAAIPEVTGTAHFTGRAEFSFDREDPLRHGFILR